MDGVARHRLYFDWGIIFWRDAEDGPESFQAPGIDSDYPVVDVAEAMGLRGVRLLGYWVEPLNVCDAQVAFDFENGSRLVFRCVEDVTTYGDAHPIALYLCEKRSNSQHSATACSSIVLAGRLARLRWECASETRPLFGRGLVPTPDNFGAAGVPPSHPELLDMLTVDFMADGWSIKRLIRRIVLSRAYGLDSSHNSHHFEVDPDNALVWRMSKRRLEAEALRDALLFIGGRLTTEPPVGSTVARTGEGLAIFLRVAGWTHRIPTGRSICRWSETACSNRSLCSTSPTQAS